MTQRNELCPKCSHLRKGTNRNQKCLSVEVETGLFKCHHSHCGYSGRIGDNKSNAEVSKVAKTTVLKLPSTNLPDNIIQWFEGRGISE